MQVAPQRRLFGSSLVCSHLLPLLLVISSGGCDRSTAAGDEDHTGRHKHCILTREKDLGCSPAFYETPTVREVRADGSEQTLEIGDQLGSIEMHGRLTGAWLFGTPYHAFDILFVCDHTGALPVDAASSPGDQSPTHPVRATGSLGLLVASCAGPCQELEAAFARCDWRLDDSFASIDVLRDLRLEITFSTAVLTGPNLSGVGDPGSMLRATWSACR